jgi:hypothetical protein
VVSENLRQGTNRCRVAAKLLIDQDGDDAPIRAAQCADTHLDEGDLDGAIVFRRILDAIDELMRGRREGERLN